MRQRKEKWFPKKYRKEKWFPKKYRKTYWTFRILAMFLPVKVIVKILRRVR